MPNIQIHGVSKRQIPDLKAVLKSTLRGASYAKDIVVTSANDEVEDLDGNPRPYLLIEITRDEQGVLGNIKRRLADILSLNMDIEVAMLTEFIPK